MAPSQIEGDDISLRAVNLTRRINLIRGIEDLMRLRTDYIQWLHDARDAVNLAQKISAAQRLWAFQNDAVESDPGGSGGLELNFPDERARHIINLIRDSLIKWLDFLKDADLTPAIPTIYNAAEKILYFQGSEIKITERAESYQTDLLKTLFSQPAKVWPVDEVLEDWGLSPEEIDMESKKKLNRVYNAAINVNEKIAQETSQKDFLLATPKEVGINQSYLKSL